MKLSRPGTAGPGTSIIRAAAAAVLALTTSGCLVLPIANDRPLTPTFVGAVRDARTGTPIGGALVSVAAEALPGAAPLVASTRSSETGEFRVVVTTRGHWFYLAPMLEGTCAGELKVTAQGYKPAVRTVRVWSNGAVNGLCRRVIEAMDVPLTPERDPVDGDKPPKAEPLGRDG